MTSVGNTINLPRCDGTDDFEWCIYRPDHLLQYMVDEGGTASKDLLIRTLGSNCETPLTLVFYADEVTPGDVVRPENFRVCWNIGFQFMECGAALFKDDMWMPVGLFRPAIVKGVEHHIAHALAGLMRVFLWGACRLLDAGFGLRLDKPGLLRARCGNMMADGDGNKAIWQFMGASAVRCCPVCKNVLKLGHSPIKKQSYLVVVACSSTRQFGPMTNEDGWKVVDDVLEARAVLKQKEFHVWERQAACMATQTRYCITDM